MIKAPAIKRIVKTRKHPMASEHYVFEMEDGSFGWGGKSLEGPTCHEWGLTEQVAMNRLRNTMRDLNRTFGTAASFK